uniref:Uncharacterized protein n=1 Tax=Romanomermis culicivorax TaxID=13658 RepID=A0A915J878_ROMCU
MGSKRILGRRVSMKREMYQCSRLTMKEWVTKTILDKVDAGFGVSCAMSKGLLVIIFLAGIGCFGE